MQGTAFPRSDPEEGNKKLAAKDAVGERQTSDLFWHRARFDLYLRSAEGGSEGTPAWGVNPTEIVHEKS